MVRVRVALAVALLLAGPAARTVAWAVDSPAEMLPDPKQEARAEAIGRQLRCLVCQNESIEDSRAALARDLRHVVRAHVAAGETDRQIVGWMVSRYGDFIRLRPRLDWLTLPLYAMPGLAVLAGLAVALVALRRRRGEPPAPLSETERARLERLR